MTKQRIARAVAGLIFSGLIAAACGSSDSSEDSAADFCTKIAALEAEANDSADSAESLSDEVDALKDLRDSAPSEIRGDMDTVISFFDDMVAAGDDEEKLNALISGEGTAEAEAAGTALETWETENCASTESSAPASAVAVKA
jgi:hypothetical protein